MLQVNLAGVNHRPASPRTTLGTRTLRLWMVSVGIAMRVGAPADTTSSPTRGPTSEYEHTTRPPSQAPTSEYEHTTLPPSQVPTPVCSGMEAWSAAELALPVTEIGRPLSSIGIAAHPAVDAGVIAASFDGGSIVSSLHYGCSTLTPILAPFPAHRQSLAGKSALCPPNKSPPCF